MGDRSDRDVHLPAGGSAVALAVVVHPNPAMGGDRNHPLVVAVAEALAGAGVAAVRVDLGVHDVTAGAERLLDVVAVGVDELAVDRVVLVGYSWGSVVSATARPSGLVGRVLVAPPAAKMPLPELDDRPVLALVPAHDQFGPPDVVRAALDEHPSATVEVIEGCDHFLAGAVNRIATRTAEWVTAQL